MTAKNTLWKLICFAFVSIFCWSKNLAQSPNNSSLQLSEIMKGNEFVGHQPENLRWTSDGKYILFDWNPENNPGNSTYCYSLNDKTYKKADAGFFKHYTEFDKTQQDAQELFSLFDGGLVLFQVPKKEYTLLYKTTAYPHSLQRIKNSRHVYFVAGNNLYFYNGWGIEQVTNFQKDDDENKSDSTFLEKQQVELFQYVRDQNKRSDWYEKQDMTFFKGPKKIITGRERVDNIQISPDEKFVFFRLSTYADEKDTYYQQFITADGHATAIPARPKVRDNDNAHRLGIYNREKDTVYYVDFSTLSDIRQKPAYLTHYQKELTPYEKDRKIVMHKVVFSQNGKYAIVDIRSYDNKNRWIASIDVKTGKITELEKQYDEAWIGGPGISEWNEEEATLGFLNDQETIFFQSEESGYSHLYTYSLSKKTKKALTSGNWEVHKVELSKDGSLFFITANKTHPGNRDFYTLKISDGKLTPILTANGYHEVSVAPDEKSLAVRYSFKNQPWELYICKLEENAKLQQVTFSTTSKFKNYKWRAPEVVKIKGSDGKEFFARIYTPENNTKNNAAIFFVHGAGYLQNAHNYWSYYVREYMFHNLLTDNGYTVIDIDYRASEGYGRDYRTAVYRSMGDRDLNDYLDAKKYLTEKYGIDSNRVGIYGGSYGGFITLMGMLKTPTAFKCGAALRSVTDWAHYNHEYTSNILNYPETDPIAYKISSPIYYAQNLKGRLLMLHGMVDDNVQFQDVVRLSQRFIELGKSGWELAVFPVEAHGFKETYSWTDEYRRIYELFYEELIENYLKK